MDKYLFICILLYTGISISRLEAAVTVDIRPSDSEQERAVGQGASWTCQLAGLGADATNVELQWWNPQGQRVTTTDARERVRISGSGVTVQLKITAVEKVDAGAWTCKTVLADTEHAKFFQLNTWESIKFVNPEELQEPEIFTNALIKCVVEGDPAPTVAWSFGPNAIVFGGRYIQNFEGLEIRNISEEDNGQYVCEATQQGRGSFDTLVIQVRVTIPPKFPSPPFMLVDNAIAGQDFKMGCKATGKPDPTYEWYKVETSGDIPIFSNDRYIVDELLGTLEIKSLVIEDEADYKCTARNKGGSSDISLYVDVQIPPSIVRITDGTGAETGDARLECVSTGDPPPDMSWRKEGEGNSFPQQPDPTDPNSNRFILQESAGGGEKTLTLTISRLTANDIANYTCISQNAIGSVEKVAFLDVQFQPSFNDKTKAVSYNWQGAGPRDITCIVDGNPVPIVRWFKGAEISQNNGTFNIRKSNGVRQTTSNLSVTVDFANQDFVFGDYECEAENTVGKQRTTISLERASTPGAPTGVQLEIDRPTLLEFSVAPPGDNGGIAVEGYRVIVTDPAFPQAPRQIDVDANRDRWDENDPLPRTQIIVPELEPITHYNFEFLARNPVGYGVPHPMSRTTKNIDKPGIVRVNDAYNHRVTEFPHKFIVSWVTPDNGGSPILKYIVKYRQVIVNASTKEVIDFIGDYITKEVAADKTSYELTDLQANKTYQIQVAAKNKLGNSPERSIVVTTARGTDPANVYGDARTISAGLTVITTIAINIAWLHV